MVGALKGDFGVTKEEVLAIIKQIENDKAFLRDPERVKMLEELGKHVKSVGRRVRA